MRKSSSALGEGEVAVAVDGVEGVEGVATEEPTEAGAGGVGGGKVAGDESGFLARQTRTCPWGPHGCSRGMRACGRGSSFGIETWSTIEGWDSSVFGLCRIGLKDAGAELLDGEDGPLEGLVEGLIGGFDGGGIGEDVAVMLRLGGVLRGNGSVEVFEAEGECGAGGRGGVSTHGHEERKEAAVVAGGVDVEAELDGMDLRTFLIGSEDAGLGAGNGDGGGEVGVVGVEDVEAG